jgi:hypothetical protein
MKNQKKEIFKNCEIKIRPIKIIKFNLRWRKVRLGLPSFFLSHTSFSTLFETLSGSRCSCITYQQCVRVPLFYSRDTLCQCPIVDIVVIEILKIVQVPHCFALEVLVGY